MFGGHDFRKSDIDKCGDNYGGDDNVCFWTRSNQFCDNVEIGNDALGVTYSKAFQKEAYEKPNVYSGKNLRKDGGKYRRQDICVQLLLSKIKFQYELYPKDADQSSRQILVINNIEVKDKLLTSEFNKMLYLHTSPSKPKQYYANMVVIKLVHNRTNPLLNIDECSLKVSLLPIRLNIDQDAVQFLYSFYLESVNLAREAAVATCKCVM